MLVAGLARAESAAVRRPGQVARAIQIAGATMAFLLAYATLTILHSAGHEPDCLAALSPIPLFRRVLASSMAGGSIAWTLNHWGSHPNHAVRLLPWALAATIAIALSVVLVFA